MAARPVAALVSLCLPQTGGESLAKRLYAGIVSTAANYNVAIAGGDVNSWNGPLVINVTALGEVQPGRQWQRSGARPGVRILVTGSFGGSILGRHLEVEPRVNEALWLAEHAEVRAAIDVSDGLSLDLARVAEASGCGAALDLPSIPISPAAKDLSQQRADGSTPLDHALGDGEDFELILAASENEARRLVARQPFDVSLRIVGQFVERPGLWITATDGELTPLVPRGWEHRLDA
jgi:thiamine-monophosphate kinase